MEAAICSITMLLWTEGRQYSGRELQAMFSEAGFTEIEVKCSFGLWSIVTGRKP
jgi:acetylserotonin N-methyltransferase